MYAVIFEKKPENQDDNWTKKGENRTNIDYSKFENIQSQINFPSFLKTYITIENNFKPDAKNLWKKPNQVHK